MQNQNVLIALGGNLGDVPKTFQQALHLLEIVMKDCQMSPLYLSKAVYDKPGAIEPEQPAPNYINAVLRGKAELPPQDLLIYLLDVEKQLGRVRPAPECSPRTIDLDLLLYEDRIIMPQKDGDLELPHPRMHQRDFVLVPSCDVAPEWIHPVFKQSLRALCDAFLRSGNSTVRMLHPQE